MQWAEMYASMHRGKNQVAQPPLPRPWEQPVDKPVRHRSETEKKEARQKLNDAFGITE